MTFILVLLSTIISLSRASSSFSILPSSQVVSVDEEAVFRCRHPTADFIGWIVNGSSVGTNPPPDVFVSTVQDDNGNTVHTLTIVGRPDYNGTTVVCEAFYRDTRPIELSPEALLQVLLNSTHTPPQEFVLSPVDQVVAQGQHAAFNCQHSTAHSIGWRLNRIPLLDTSLVGVEARSTALPGGVLNTLTIEALPEYNLTIIECVAVFFDDSPSEATGGATLTIQGPLDAVVTPPPTTPPPTTPPPTTPTPTTLPPTTPLPTTFFPLGEFALSPVDQVVAQGQHAVFNCQHSTAHSIGWRLNGTPFLDTSLVGVEARSTALPGGVLNTLTIVALPGFNLTNIECVATFFDDSPSEATEPVTLTIQGPLDAVTALVRTPSLITWEPPFSLDLTYIEPNIIYSIEVFLIDCGELEEDFILRDSNVTTNHYDVDNLVPGFTYKIIVTPRSNVVNALPGLPFELEEEYASPANLEVIVNFTTHNTPNVSIYIHFNKSLSGIVPESYTLSLAAVDGLADQDSLLVAASRSVLDYSQDDYKVVVLSTSLPRKRLWLFTVLPNNCSGMNNSITDAKYLSTHDIQNVSRTSLQSGEIQVSGDFVDGTSATGALVIVYSDELTRYHLAPRGPSGRFDAIIADLPRGEYRVSVFTMEENGLPFERAVTQPLRADVNTTNKQAANNQQSWIEYELTSSPAGVNVTCHFLDTPTTECLVVVHTLSSTLSKNGLTNISSKLFTRSQNEEPFVIGFIEGISLEEYQVGVIGGVKRVNVVQPAGYICEGHCLILALSFGVFVAAGLLTIVSLTSVYVIKRGGRICWSGREENTANDTHVDLKRCTAYEVTTLSRKKVVMKENPAYELVSVS